MELEQLRIFAAVAESGGFSAAARKLYISHSTTSRAVTALEEELGVRLFERGNRIDALTPAGKVLLREARELLETAERAAEKVRLAAKSGEGNYA